MAEAQPGPAVFVVSIFGLLVMVLAGYVLVAPDGFFRLLERFEHKGLFPVAVGLRAAMGGACLYAAPSCRLPLFVQAVGALALVAAFALLIMGPGRFASIVAWWRERGSAFARIWGLVALGFGGLLVYAGT